MTIGRSVSLPASRLQGGRFFRRLLPTAFAIVLGAVQSGAVLSASLTFQSVFNFYSGPGGANPNGKVLLVSPNLGYGTTYFGGVSNSGIVYQLTHNQDGTYSEAVLYSFLGGNDGGNPAAGLLMDGRGNLYGTASTSNGQPNGVVFELSPGANGWTYNVIHSFGDAGDGANPNSNLVSGPNGGLFGTTVGGGANGAGTVFRLLPPAVVGGAWTESVLYSFSGVKDGAAPYAGLAADSSNNLYGTCYAGGTDHLGTVFKLSPPVKGTTTWTETTLYSFTGGIDGGRPLGGVTLTQAGTIIGTTFNGGSGKQGVIFELTPAMSGGYTESVLIAFNGANGANPSDTLVADSTGLNYVGTTGGAQAGLGGNVFKLTPSGNATHPYNISVLYTFSGGADGQAALPSVSQSARGVVFGTTFYGGQGGAGSVFEIY